MLTITKVRKSVCEGCFYDSLQFCLSLNIFMKKSSFWKLKKKMNLHAPQDRLCPAGGKGTFISPERTLH